MELDIFARMSDVELLAELRRIVCQAGQRRDLCTAREATTLFEAFYAHRLEQRVPGRVWEDTRAFVRQHAY